MIWLASYPKSGNTWVRVFLRCYFEDRAVSLADISKGWSDASPHLWAEAAEKPVDEITEAEAPWIRLEVHRLAESLPWCKTHNAILRADGFPTLRHLERAVYIVRDPRDVCVSLADHMGLSIDETIAYMADEGARASHGDSEVSSFLSSWSRHVRSWVRDSVLFVRYEDLKTRPGPEFRRILTAFGRVDTPRMLRAMKASAFERLRADEAENGFTEKGRGARFFREGRSGGWREALTAGQAGRIVADHGEMMERLGYG